MHPRRPWALPYTPSLLSAVFFFFFFLLFCFLGIDGENGKAGLKAAPHADIRLSLAVGIE